MNKHIKRSIPIASGIMTAIFTIEPESIFSTVKVLPGLSDEVNIIIARCIVCVIVCVIVFLITWGGVAVYANKRKKVCIKGDNYNIEIEYGDLLEQKDCWRVISFDECFTTKVGTETAQIKPGSICGQYLTMYPLSMSDMKQMISKAGVSSKEKHSRYKNKKCYLSGTLVPREDNDLLMAFAKLDEDGRGGFDTVGEYMDCLAVLWDEIDKYYGQKDVCISVLGAGLTRLPDASLTQQKLLDLIISSYKISTHKIKAPCKLRIICKETEGFSLDRIGECL